MVWSSIQLPNIYCIGSAALIGCRVHRVSWQENGADILFEMEIASVKLAHGVWWFDYPGRGSSLVISTSLILGFERGIDAMFSRYIHVIQSYSRK